MAKTSRKQRRRPPLWRVFGLRVRHLRKLSLLTQEELAAAIDKTVHTVSNIERGANSTRIETAADLAKALGVTLSELFDIPVERQAKQASQRR